MSDKTTTHKVSLNGLTLLGILFVCLKLTGYIDWSWWWVTLPFWGGLAVVVGLMLVIIACSLIAALLE